MTAPYVIDRSRHELGTMLASVVGGTSLPVITQEQLIRQLLDLQTKFERVVSCR